MNIENKRILVTGGNGFLGKSLIRKLKEFDVKEIFSPSSNELDLRIKSNCQKVVKDIDVIFHLAGNSGGLLLLSLLEDVDDDSDPFFDFFYLVEYL